MGRRSGSAPSIRASRDGTLDAMVDHARDKPGSEMHEAALEIFEGLATSYERVLDVATLAQDRYWKRWVYENAEVKSGDLVLDVGCGTCLLEEQLDRCGCNLVGLDLTERMIRIGRSKEIPGVVGLVHGDAESLPFPDGIFDVVVSCYVPKYVDVTRFVKEASRVLKIGGRIALYDFVRPNGLLSPFLRLYIGGVLPIVGQLLEFTRSEASITFKNLPRIIDGTTWDKGIAEAFERESVRRRTFKALSRGVVGAYSGTKTDPRGR